MKLINLGCGDLKIEGALNVDMSSKCNPDFVWDIRETPFPREWEQSDRIEMNNLAEHIDAETFIRIVNECHRILKPGGELWIKVPELREGNLMPCFTDPTHVNYFTCETFQYFHKGKPRQKAFGKDYGIIPWSDRRQESKGIFLEVTLIK